MATANSTQAGLRLPLAGLAPPRVLMCASMGAEGSVTLQLREAVQAPDSNSSLDSGLTIGYPDPEILADMLGTLQAAGGTMNSTSSDEDPFDLLGDAGDDNLCFRGDAMSMAKSTSNGLGNENSLDNYEDGFFCGPSETGGRLGSGDYYPEKIINSCSIGRRFLLETDPAGKTTSSGSGSGTSMTNITANGSAGGNHKTATSPSLATLKKPRPKTASPTRHGPQQCQVCSKVFGNASALAKHKLTHSDERKYICGMCSKAFKRQDHLNGHMLTHRNKKPFECKAEGCGKSYCDARSLRRHTENHHSSLAMTPTTPNQSMSSSTGPPTGLSLSPATASGDASSPHGATCIIPSGADGSSPKSESPNSPAATTASPSSSSSNSSASNSSPASSSSSSSSSSSNGNEGLTRQQLDLISQIMQQTKQANASAVASQKQVVSQQRPRTWNMQTQLQQSSGQQQPHQQQVKMSPAGEVSISTITLNGIATLSSTSSSALQSSTPATVTAITTTSSTTAAAANGLNFAKMEQKPVECNLCHRKFKNIPALNGHMRLHGGYFKKDAETKKFDKKDPPGPPLQTASIGVRALIEEKIISKRGKDLKGAFAVPAPPLATTRRSTDSEPFFTPKLTAASSQETSGSAPTMPSVNSPTKGQQQQQPQSSTVQPQLPSTIHLSVTTTAINSGTTILSSTSSGSGGVTHHLSKAISQISSPVTVNSSTASGNSIILSDNKDATLIELLKRGTKVAVKRACSDPGQLVLSTATTTSSNTVHQQTLDDLLGNNKSHLSSALSNDRNTVGKGAEIRDLTPSVKTENPPSSTSSLSLTNGTQSVDSNSPPSLALTIAQTPSNSDVFTLAYTTDSSSPYFGENEVYSVNDTAMLLQAVDSIQLLHESSSNVDQLDDIGSLSDYGLDSDTDHLNLSSFTTSSRQLQAVLNSPLPESLAEFSALHSKDYILYNCKSNSPASHNHQSVTSPLPSPLAYPTPPASHEAVAQSSPFLDDTHQSSDNSPFFGDEKKNYLESKLSLNKDDRILQLKNELFNDSKSVMEDNDDHFYKDDNETENRLQDLAFLDEPQSFLDDARNASSPLSAALFSSTMSSAEEVKEALQEVLPNEHIGDETPSEADIDLYYLPNLQSQMMSNSDDPLLSSSPKDFASKQLSPILINQKFDFGVFNPPSNKRIKTDPDVQTKVSLPLTVQTEPIQQPKDSEVFLSPSSISSTSTATHSPRTATSNPTTRKRQHSDVIPRAYELYKSRLKRPSSHFTPAPILNPTRSTTTGIYNDLMIAYGNELRNSDGETAADVVGDLFGEVSQKPRINIGPGYQAAIPKCNSPAEANLLNRNPDALMWSPDVATDVRELQRFVGLSKSSAVPMGGGNSSEETALKVLLDCNGEIHTAVLELLQAPPTNIHKHWSSQEINLFLRGLEKWRKAFHKISTEIPNKTTADCVQLYYFWKKLCSDYKSTHLQQPIWPAEDPSCPRFPTSSTTPSNNISNCLPLAALSSPSGGIALTTTTSTSGPSASLASTSSSSSSLSTTSPSSSSSSSSSSTLSHQDIRPHICEMPDCSASFSSKAALHGHTKLHCMGRSLSSLSSANSSSHINSAASFGNHGNPLQSKDDFPCKVCGKIFNKVKSRSAHMKSHRPQDSDSSTT